MAHSNSNTPAFVLFVKFKSALPLEKAREVVNSRIGEFRALDGLTQKYYLHERSTGEYAGLYLWESAEALTAFQRSELRATIARAYEVEGEPRVEVLEVFEVLRDGAR